MASLLVTREPFATALRCQAGGNVHIGGGAFLGAGEWAVPGATVGKWATVGASSVVLHDVPDSTTVVGVPARELRKGD